MKQAQREVPWFKRYAWHGVVLLGLLIVSVMPRAEAQIVYVAEKDHQRYILVGTIHLGSGPETRLSDAVADSMLRADHVYFELTMRDLQSGLFDMMRAGRRQEGTLEQALGPQLWEEFSAFTRAHGMPGAQINQLEMWLVTTLLSAQMSQKAGFFAHYGIEAPLYGRLAQQQIQERGLERTAAQVEALRATFSRYDDAELAKRLMEDAEGLHEELTRLEASWRAGDLDRLMDAIYAQETTESLYAILDARNLAWFAYLESVYIQPAEPVELFIAVGAGHIGGETGLKTRFQEAGFSVTPWDEYWGE